MSVFHSRFVMLFAFAWAVSATAPALAEADVEPRPDRYTLAVGLCGYSPVSYFTEGRAEPGSPAHRVEHDGVTYFVTSDTQAELFEADPARYTPAYGGWCAFGMAVEDHFEIDPEAWLIEDGRLMVFLRNDEVDARALWQAEDRNDVRGKADAFWRRTHGDS